MRKLLQLAYLIIYSCKKYNTGHYCIDSNGYGFECKGASETNINQLYPKFIVNSFVRLKQIVPKETLTVPGQPSDVTAAGLNTVYHGVYKDQVYTELCKAYKTPAVINDPQFGGIMTWSINQDADNDFKFIDGVLAENCETVKE